MQLREQKMSRIPLQINNRTYRKRGSSTFIPCIPSASIATTSSPRLSAKSCHADKRIPFTLPQTPHSNFITDTIITEGPRAVCVSETGEKSQIDLTNELHKFQTNPFLSSGNASFMVIDRDYALAELSPILEKIDETKPIDNDSTTDLNKKAAVPINLKRHLVFTPRRARRSIGVTTTEDLIKRTKTKYCHAQTQTQAEIICAICHRSLLASMRQPASGKRKHSKRNEMHSLQQKSPKISLDQLLPNALLVIHLPNASNLNEPLNVTTFDMQSSSSSSPRSSIPKRIRTFRSATRSRSTTNPFLPAANIKEFSEVTTLVKVITIISFISILLLTLFDVNGIVQCLMKCWHSLKTMLLGEKPKPPSKTKLEIFMEFFTDFLS